jgi:hypothetical protein
MVVGNFSLTNPGHGWRRGRIHSDSQIVGTATSLALMSGLRTRLNSLTNSDWAPGWRHNTECPLLYHRFTLRNAHQTSSIFNKSFTSM